LNGFDASGPGGGLAPGGLAPGGLTPAKADQCGPIGATFPVVGPYVMSWSILPGKCVSRS